jgi:hypothetical protein
MLFRAEGRENMVADRAYSPGLLASTDRRASLVYFAAAVPAIGFVHGPSGLNPLNAATLESYPEGGSLAGKARLRRGRLIIKAVAFGPAEAGLIIVGQ